MRVSVCVCVCLCQCVRLCVFCLCVYLCIYVSKRGGVVLGGVHYHVFLHLSARIHSCVLYTHTHRVVRCILSFSSYMRCRDTNISCTFLPPSSLPPSSSSFNFILHTSSLPPSSLFRVPCFPLPGAFYAMPRVSEYYGSVAPDGQVIADAEQLCLYLLTKHR